MHKPANSQLSVRVVELYESLGLILESHIDNEALEFLRFDNTLQEHAWRHFGCVEASIDPNWVQAKLEPSVLNAT